MAHEIGTIEDVPKGDTLELPFTLTEDGTAKDITGYIINYYIVRRGNIIDRKDNNTDIDLTIVDAANGKFKITLQSGVTSDYDDYVDEIVRIDDGRGNKVTFFGHINFESVPV